MKERVFTLFAAFAMTLVSVAGARALPFQTFVSSTGNDASNCTQSTPCRTFSGAVPKTSVRGVITALDSSTYGIVTIDKALTIQAAPGVYAVLEGGRADDVVTISAGGSDAVVLRNLHIVSRSAAANTGVRNTGGVPLHVESCVIEGFGDSGIYTHGTSFVIDTILRANATGIRTGFGKASIDRCRIESNHTGVLIDRGTTIIRDSVVAGNSDFGVDGQFPGADEEYPSIGGLENCVVAHNGTGINISAVHGGPVFYVSSTMILNNIRGVSGVVVSFGNNRLVGNQSNGSMALISQH